MVRYNRGERGAALMRYQPRRKSVVSATPSSEAGAALITVLLFVVLMFILITAMLSVAGNEIVISGLQRDGVRATELAQAGIQEAIRRVERGRPYIMTGGFTSALDPRVNVKVTQVFPGANSAYLQIDATAANIGTATRRLTALVLQEVIAFPPNITFAYSVTEQGSATISCGDAYSQTFIQYKNYPANPPVPPCTEPPPLTYTGWRVSKVAPGAITPCYTHADCTDGSPDPVNANTSNWYPGTRRTEPESTSLGQEILAFKTASEAIACGIPPAYSALLPAGAILQTNADGSGLPQYGFDVDDPVGAAPRQLDPDLFPCGLPYKWIWEVTYDESGLPVAGGNPVNTRWFKTIVFDEWFENYWRFDETKLTAVKRGNGAGTQACLDSICLSTSVPPVQPDLLLYPQFGAVPPFPDITSLENNYHCQKTGTGVINSLPTPCTALDGTATSMDFGCVNPEMAGCVADRQAWFELNGSWEINGTIGGHGTIVVNGDLIVNGTFEYWGTIIVNGTLQAGTGNVIVHGGLVAQSTLQLIGNIIVEGGGTVTNVATGDSIVIGKAWWER